MLAELELKSTKQLLDGFLAREKKVSDKFGLLKFFKICKDPSCDTIRCIVGSFGNIFIGVEKNPQILCEQICLNNFQNIEELLSSELVDLNWTKRDRFFLSPNVLYISEVFDRLSKLLTLYMLLDIPKKKILKRIDNVIRVMDILLSMRNFNSAYASFLA